MPRKQKQHVARKSTRTIADARRVRYGGGAKPRLLRSQDAMTRDSRVIRFGGGCCPASLRK